LLALDRIGTEPKGEGIIRLAIRDRLVARDPQDGFEERSRFDTELSEE
jgi:hypothetical protein